jgi:pyruvate, water dikinase
VDSDYVIPLHEVGKHDVNIAGGKGANLGEMIKMGISVPQGFVVTTLSFDSFIQTYKLGNRIQEIVESTDVGDTAKLLECSQKIRETILSYEIPLEVRLNVIKAYRKLSGNVGIKLGSKIETGPQLVAVRSSATTEDLPNASFAGQHSSFLNVKGEEDLIESIRKCWASLFEPRAIFYRTKRGFSKASMAVIVQRMVNSDKSGTMFTTDPITGQNVVLIEAIYGLGESIVSGEASPDLYKLSKEKAEQKGSPNIDVQISKKLKMRTYDCSSTKTVDLDVPQSKINSQVLTEDELVELTRYGILLEDHYGGRPQDIEFAIENGKIKILQTRAITTSVKRQVEKFIELKGRQLLKGIGASPGAASGRVRIITDNKELTRIENGDIIVTTMTSPDLVPSMSNSAAIITDLGGRTCHAAIVSREMGIPAVVGTQEATRILKEGQEITVDAYNGVVYEGKFNLDIVPAEQEQAISVGGPLPSSTTRTRTKIKVNLAFSQRLEEIEPKVDGVGLLRIEHMVAQSGVHPARLIKDGRKEEYVKILMDGIRPIAKAFAPKPIWIRTLDARSDEFRNLKGGEDEPREANPMLGWHGIRRSLAEPELLIAELEAIMMLHEGEGLNNLEIMLPFVISVEEVNKAKEIAKQVGFSDKLKIGIMVETPASVMIIDELCKEAKISFASFGTNDLIQLTLGIDRNNERLSNLASTLHPAVLRSMKAVIASCNQAGVETSICGESGSSPEIARILVRYGIKSISCNIDAIDTIRKTVYEEEQKQEFQDRKYDKK